MARTALLSVSDKTSLVPFAKGLSQLGWRLVSTGGTLKTLVEAGLRAISIDQLTGHPEILEGRVKTLHPKVHGGLLGRPHIAEHKAQMDENGIEPIDLVVVNLYPFEATVARGAAIDEAIENIDIGGPSMLRSAAKNHERVTVVCDPADYEAVLAEFKTGDTTLETRKRLAIKVYATTSRYDSAIERHLAKEYLGEQRLDLRYGQGQTMRYGENNHQKAVFYKEPAAVAKSESSIGTARQLHGKELSFNNIVDADAAIEAARELRGTYGVAIIKHTNPCGYATGVTLDAAFTAAWDCDPVSAFGSVIATTRPVDLATAQCLKGRFVEILAAPAFEPDALEYLKTKSKDIRILEIGSLRDPEPRPVYRHVIGGMLEQDRDIELFAKFESATRLAIPQNKTGLAEFAWKACKHVKSNAIAIACEYSPGQYQLIGMGPGQPNRIDSNKKLAQTRVLENLARLTQCPPPEGFASLIGQMVLASDAFFPFDDNVVAAHEFGIRYIVQPGGSMRDAEVIAKADELGMAMAFTGTRHFRH